MKPQLTIKDVKSIAEDLDMGMKCYINKETREIKSLLDENDYYDADPELWEAEYEIIETQWKDYSVIEKMSSRDGYEVMRSFLKKVTSKRMKNNLVRALEGRKPFANFKFQVDKEEDTRQAWFKHKLEEYMNYVILELRDDFEVPDLINRETYKQSKEIDLDGITMTLEEFDPKWGADEETVFIFEQKDNLVTVEYHGGNIVYGNMIGNLNNNEIIIVFQCLTKANKLGSVYAMGKVVTNENDEHIIFLNWRWYGGHQDAGIAKLRET